jgi:hypothetical protein
MRLKITLMLILLLVFPHVWGDAQPQVLEFIYFERIVIANNGDIPVMLEDYYRYSTLFINTSSQVSFLINSTPSVLRTFMDEDGMLNIELNAAKTINPYSYIQISTTHKIIVYKDLSPPEDLSIRNSGMLSDIPESLRNYTKSIGAWSYDNAWMSYLKDKALELKGDDENVLSIVLKFIDWIGRNVRYPEKPLEGPLYPNETIPNEKIQRGELGIGDCDDQASLLITLCRSVGIPAYLQYGCIYFKDRKYYESFVNGHINFRYHYIGWHGWAIIYIPPWGWLPADLTWGYLITRNPIDAIMKAAIYQCWKAGTPIFICGNIINSNHVEVDREVRRKVGNSSIYIYIDNILIPADKQLDIEVEKLPEIPLIHEIPTTTHKHATTPKPVENNSTVIAIVVVLSISLYLVFKGRRYVMKRVKFKREYATLIRVGNGYSIRIN